MQYEPTLLFFQSCLGYNAWLANIVDRTLVFWFSMFRKIGSRSLIISKSPSLSTLTEEHNLYISANCGKAWVDLLLLLRSNWLYVRDLHWLSLAGKTQLETTISWFVFLVSTDLNWYSAFSLISQIVEYMNMKSWIEQSLPFYLYGFKTSSIITNDAIYKTTVSLMQSCS